MRKWNKKRDKDVSGVIIAPFFKPSMFQECLLWNHWVVSKNLRISKVAISKRFEGFEMMLSCLAIQHTEWYLEYSNWC